MTAIERQRWLRIRLSLAAFAYEMLNVSIMSDAEFDRLSLEVDPNVQTGNDLLDQFFAESFDPSSGVWIHKHPELSKIAGIYAQHYATVSLIPWLLLP